MAEALKRDSGLFRGVLLASDYDGTLVPDTKVVTPGVRKALRFFEENGGRFTVCTGRCYLGFHSYSRDIINAPVLLANGGMAYDYERAAVAVDNGIGDEGIEPLRAVAARFPDVTIELYPLEMSYAIHLLPKSEHHFTSQSIPFETIDDPSQAPRTWAKVMIGGVPERVGAVQAFLRGYPEISFLPTTGGFLEVLRRGVDKGTALLQLADALGVRHEDTYVLTALVCIVTLYPLIYVLSASFSNPARILGGDVVLWPVEFTLNSYKRVFASSDILTGYRNTLIYTAAGTTLNMIATIMAAYPLSLPDLKGKNAITIFITFTMFFGAGMIPNYLNIKSLGLLNNPLVVIVPGAIGVSNMLIMRNYFIHSVPAALREAASIDGASPFATMVRIVLPLSKSILIVIILYYMVGHWNSYFSAMMYLPGKRNLQPLQVFLREILVLTQMGDMEEQTGVDDLGVYLLYASLKYAIIVVSAVPLLVLYPMVQKFFERGIMMGSIKG